MAGVEELAAQIGVGDWSGRLRRRAGPGRDRCGAARLNRPRRFETVEVVLGLPLGQLGLVRIAGAVFVLGVLVTGCAAGPAVNRETNAWMEIRGEKLMFPVPDDYEVAHQRKTGNMEQVKLVPKGRTKSNWTEMIIGQFYSGGVAQKTPGKFYEWMSAEWHNACPNGNTELIESKDLNGYPSASWWMACPKNPSSKRPEVTFVMAVAAKETFIVVQKVWRSVPPQELVDKWKDDLFSAVIVCDTHDAERHPCPAMGKSDPSGE